MNSKKLYKPRSLIFCKDKTNHKERLIYNYLLYKLKKDEKIIKDEKKYLDKKNYDYKGHNLQITFKELKDNINLTKKSDIEKMFDNLRNIDIEEHSLNVGRKNKSTFKAKLIGDIKQYNKEDGYFELTFSPLIVDLVVFNNNDYETLFLEDLVKFKSKYSLILYEVLRASYRANFKNNQPLTIDLEDFKSLLNVENYNISNLKKRVLNMAKVDIENKTDYSFEYEFLTGDYGKNYRFIKLTFDIKVSSKKEVYIENKKVKNLSQSDLVFLLQNKVPQNSLIEKLLQENKELYNALSLEKRKNELSIDYLDAQYQKENPTFQNNEDYKLDSSIDNLDEVYIDNELCF